MACKMFVCSAFYINCSRSYKGLGLMYWKSLERTCSKKHWMIHFSYIKLQFVLNAIFGQNQFFQSSYLIWLH